MPVKLVSKYQYSSQYIQQLLMSMAMSIKYYGSTYLLVCQIYLLVRHYIPTNVDTQPVHTHQCASKHLLACQSILTSMPVHTYQYASIYLPVCQNILLVVNTIYASIDAINQAVSTLAIIHFIIIHCNVSAHTLVCKNPLTSAQHILTNMPVLTPQNPSTYLPTSMTTGAGLMCMLDTALIIGCSFNTVFCTY